ncbi:RING-H2 finger protein ATL78 [Linum perenne]
MDSTTNHVLLQITMARRLLLDSSPSPVADPDSKFDAKVVMIVSVLLCAMIFSLILNSIVRCTLRCFNSPPPAASQLSGAATTAKLANTGIKKKALKTFPVVTFSDELNLDAECVICLSEFAVDDLVKILPTCNHGFHVGCIDQWLGSHSSCPTCRHCLIETCRKIVRSNNGDAPSATVAVAEDVVISMPPMEAEGPVREHRIINSVLFWRKN